MTEPDWAGLRDAVRDRLDATGATPGEVAKRAGLSRETVRPILNAVPANYRPATLAKVSIALGWTGPSIQRILDGHKPERATGSTEERLTALEGRLDRIEELLTRREGRHAPQ